jgi:hypothetical protein
VNENQVGWHSLPRPEQEHDLVAGLPPEFCEVIDGIHRQLSPAILAVKEHGETPALAWQRITSYQESRSPAESGTNCSGYSR